MTVTTSLGEHTGTIRSCSFAHASDMILCCIVNLVNAVNRENYAAAWLMACDLGRAIVHAESLTLQMAPGVARVAATARLDSLRAVATCALASAPRPSPLAIAQARATTGGVDRSVWAYEEQQWLAVRRATGPLSIITHGDNLILRSLHT